MLTETQKRVLTEASNSVPALRKNALPAADKIDLGVLLAQGRISAIQKTINFDDAEVAVVAMTTGAIPFGSALPENATFIGAHWNVIDDFDDGATGTFDGHLGVTGAADRFEAAANLDAIADVTTPGPVYIGANPTNLVWTITGDVNLSTLTGGQVVLTVYYIETELEVV